MASEASGQGVKQRPGEGAVGVKYGQSGARKGAWSGLPTDTALRRRLRGCLVTCGRGQAERVTLSVKDGALGGSALDDRQLGKCLGR